MRQANYGGFQHAGMSHDGIFQIHRGNPLTPRFNDILNPVHNFDVALLIDCHNIAGTEPAINHFEKGFIRIFVIFLGYPRPPYQKLSHLFAIPLNLIS